MTHKTDMQAVLLDAMRVISESADEIKAGCAIDDEWPDAEDKAEYDRRVAVLERVRAIARACATPSTSGYCEEGDRCVCGGDLPRVREGCANWRNAPVASAGYYAESPYPGQHYIKQRGNHTDPPIALVYGGDNLRLLMGALASRPDAQADERGAATTPDAIRALQRLEAACDQRAALLTPEAYLAAEKAPGMREALYELDMARREACEVLARAAAPQAEAAQGVPEGITEGLEILDNFIASVRENGNYSTEATLTFIGQARQCFAAAPAPVSEPYPATLCEDGGKCGIGGYCGQCEKMRAASEPEQPSKRGEQDCPHGVDDGACKQCYGEATSDQNSAKHRYFVYDPEGNGFDLYDTDAQRDAAHLAAIAEARQVAMDDGEWALDVERIVSGFVTHATVATDMDGGGCDYAPLSTFNASAPMLGAERTCTCHPDDNPPKPCPQKYAYSECASAQPQAAEQKGCPRCKSSTAAGCNDIGCGYLDSGNGEPNVAEPKALYFKRSPFRGGWTTFNIRDADADEAERRLLAKGA